MGSFYMEATQINYRRDETLKTVDQKLQELSETSAIDTDIAPVFSKTATYNPGDMVYYKNKLYVFNVEHTGAWAAADVTATDVTTEISSLKSGLTNVNADVKLNTNDLTTPSRTKNILPITLASIKALNTDGTWSGSSYTVNGVTFAVSTDSNGNISKINATGTASGVTYLILVNPFDTVSLAGCLINGLPSEGSSNSFNYRIASSASWSALQDINSNNTAITNNGATCRIAIRIQDTYEIATGGIDFYPMVRIATETDATYAPYIPSVESRIEAVESVVTSYTLTPAADVTINRASCVKIMNTVIVDAVITLGDDKSASSALLNGLPTIGSTNIPIYAIDDNATARPVRVYASGVYTSGAFTASERIHIMGCYTLTD